TRNLILIAAYYFQRDLPERDMPEQPLGKPTPAVPVHRSIHRDHLDCLECGFAAWSLPRHLRAAHGLTSDQYRTKWKLPLDYPMPSPEYSEQRSVLAKRRGRAQKRLRSQ